MSYYQLNAGDHNTVKIFIGYFDGGYQVEYVRPGDADDRLLDYYGKMGVVYLYSQPRPFGSSPRFVLSDKTDNVIKKLEIDANSYINIMIQRRTGRGKRLGPRYRDSRDSYNTLKDIRRWTGWKAPSGRDIDSYYRRRENG